MDRHDSLVKSHQVKPMGLRGLFGWLSMPLEPVAPASVKMIDSITAAKVAADYGMLDKNQTGP
jgi:hypothetical protein